MYQKRVGRIFTVETNYDVERIVFVRVVAQAGNLAKPQDLFRLGMHRRPVLIVDLEASDHKIISVIKTSAKHKWGSMPMPTF
jgi:hypothetical protein